MSDQPGCVATGATLEETSAADPFPDTPDGAVAVYLRAMSRDGDQVPPDTRGSAILTSEWRGCHRSRRGDIKGAVMPDQLSTVRSNAIAIGRTRDSPPT
jgi:hypothetical protein